MRSSRTAEAAPRFNQAQRLAFVPVLGAGRYVSERRVKVVRTPEGGIAAAWTGYQNERFVVQAAPVVDGFFGAAQTVTDATVDSVLADLDAGASSELAVLRRSGVAGNDPGTGAPGLQAAVRAPGASAFGAGEIVEQGAPAYNATLRFDPLTSRAIAAWDAIGTPGRQTSVRTPVTQLRP